MAPDDAPSMAASLKRGNDGRLYQAGIADGSRISLPKRQFMDRLAVNRKRLATPAEKKLGFHFGVLQRFIGTPSCRYRREKTIHIADILSRSLDFYFPKGKIAVEADGPSHNPAERKAKDQWTDELLMKHAGIVMLRFSDDKILENIHEVINHVARALLTRHAWPSKFRQRFSQALSASQSAEGWSDLVGTILRTRD